MTAASLAFLEPCELPQDAIEVARIADAWGIKGGFKVLPYSAFPEAIFSCKQWILLPPESRAGLVVKKERQKELPFTKPQLLRITEAKEHSTGVVALAHDCTDRNAAELLKGCRIFVPRSSFPTPESNEFYWIDLIGCSVSNLEAVNLGVVKDLMHTGPQTVLVIERIESGKTLEILIPFVDAYVKSVSIENKKLTVDWQLDY